MKSTPLKKIKACFQAQIRLPFKIGLGIRNPENLNYCPNKSFFGISQQLCEIFFLIRTLRRDIKKRFLSHKS